jgi:hypothetical protein
VEIQVSGLEQGMPPPFTLCRVGPIYFSAVRRVGGRGVTDFLGGRGYPPDFLPESSITLPAIFKKLDNPGELFSKSPVTLPDNF